MFKGDDGTCTVFSISVIWRSLPEYGKRDMWSLPWPQICTGLPPIPFSPPVESINYNTVFGLLTMTLFAPVSIMYNWLSELVTKKVGSLLRCLMTRVEDCDISDGVSLIVWEWGLLPVILMMATCRWRCCLEAFTFSLSLTGAWLVPDMV